MYGTLSFHTPILDYYPKADEEKTLAYEQNLPSLRKGLRNRSLFNS